MKNYEENLDDGIPKEREVSIPSLWLSAIMLTFPRLNFKRPLKAKLASSAL